MPTSVRARITAVATVLVAAALVFASWVILQMVESDLIETTERALAAELELGIEAAEFGLVGEGVYFDFVAEGRPLGLSLFTLGDEGIAFGEIYENGFLIGEVLLDIDEIEVIDVIDPLTGQPLADPQLIAELEEAALDVRAIEDAAAETDAFFVGAVARDEVDQTLTAVQDALTLIVPALVLAIGVLTWLLVARALRPVGAMSARVDEISTSNLEARVPVPGGNDEVANLAGVMNRMLERLQRGDRRQRQFAADASHELRSPLSTVRAAAEIIEHNPTSTRTGSLATDIVAEADRMDRLIGDLLHLSRIDEEREPDDFGNVDLARIAADAASGAEVRAPTEQWIAGSTEQLHRVVANLVANAHRHARAQVIVTVAPTVNGRAELRVDDDGPGVPTEHRERIFERFSRLDDARARDAGGAGLGLALVRAIVERHGGQIHVETSPTLGGAAFVATFPLAG